MRRQAFLRFVDINLRGVGAGDASEQSADRDTFPGRDRLGLIRSRRAARGDCRRARGRRCNLTAQWLRVDEASLHSGLYGYNGILVGLALATFLAPGALLWVYVVLGAAVSVDRHARNRQRRQAMGRVRAHISVRAHNLASSVGYVWIFRARRHCAALRQRCHRIPTLRSKPAPADRSCPGCVPEHLASLPEGERRGGAASACGARREFACGRRIRPRRRDTGGR